MKYISQDEALAKLQRYCAYQERSHKEVRTKLLDIGMRGDELEEIIADLITENFLNEERYAKAYAGGKFRIKQWGRQKIKRELKMKGVSEYSIKKGMAEIDDDDYMETIKSLIEKKRKLLREKNPFILRNKIVKYLYQKGFESFLVWEIIKEEIK